MLMLGCVKRTLLIDKATRAGDWARTRRAGNTELAWQDARHRRRRQHRAAGREVRGRDRHDGASRTTSTCPRTRCRRRGAEPVASLEALLPQVDFLTATRR
jgi:phosphoglycerate dehydrogenase-like enzyme